MCTLTWRKSFVWRENVCTGFRRGAVGELRFLPRYITVALEGVKPVSAGTACGRSERSQPPESHERGMENSDHPQSRQTRMSGDGVRGGWLNVRGLLR